MKKIQFLKSTALSLAAALGLSSCTTTYDAAGRPQQTIRAEDALIGAAAVGLVGYALAKGNDKKHYKRHHRGYRNHHGHYNDGYGYGGYGRRGGYGSRGGYGGYDPYCR